MAPVNRVLTVYTVRCYNQIYCAHQQITRDIDWTCLLDFYRGYGGLDAETLLIICNISFSVLEGGRRSKR